MSVPARSARGLRPTLALLHRSLLEDSRRLIPYGWRLAVVAMLFFSVFVAYESSGFVGAPGLNLFVAVVYIDVWLITLLGLGTFAWVIAEEKQNHTLGLLRMTRLGPLSILLGKLGGALVMALALLAVQLPVIFLTIPLGGVAVHQLLHAASALTGHLVLMAGIGVLASTLGRTPRRAELLVVLALLVLHAGPWIVVVNLQNASLQDATAWSASRPAEILREGCEALRSGSVWTRLGEITATGYDGGIIERQLVSNVVLGLLAFGVAWLIFERAPHEAAAPARRRVGASARRLRRYSLFPHVMKDFHHIAGGWSWQVVKLLAYLAVIAVMMATTFRTEPRPSGAELGQFLMTLAFLGFALETSALLSAVFARERRWRTWPDLGMVPIATPRLAYQKVLGALLGTLPAVLLGLVGAVLSWPELRLLLRQLSRSPSIAAFLLGAGFLYTHLLVYFSLHLRRGGSVAAIATMGLVLILFALTMGAAIDEYSVVVTFAVLFWIGSGILHLASLGRLRILVGE